MKNSKNPADIVAELGERLRTARLNADYTQEDVAHIAGVSRKAVISAEKGRCQLENFVAILVALKLDNQLNNFLPPPELSPIQLAKLRGKQRQRASGTHKPEQPEQNEW